MDESLLSNFWIICHSPGKWWTETFFAQSDKNFIRLEFSYNPVNEISSKDRIDASIESNIFFIILRSVNPAILISLGRLFLD